MIRKPKTFETVFETKFERTMTSKETSEAIALIEENFKSCESTKTDKRKGSVHHTRIVLGLNVLNRRIEELEMVIMVRDACALFRSLLQRDSLVQPAVYRSENSIATKLDQTYSVSLCVK